MTRPVASVSLDLDNQWSYMKTHGDPGWQKFPSYLDRLVPRVLAMLADRHWRITFFVVGQDAALPANQAALQQLVGAGHEVGNHSFHHEPWLQRYPRARLEREIAEAEEAILAATGRRPVGFRGPGFSASNDLLEVLAARGYRFDATTLPTWIGPFARWYYFRQARLSAEERADRADLFGNWRDGVRPLRPYRWQLRGGTLLEIPVTTMPIFRLPFHLSYVLYLGTYSSAAASAYFRAALALCRGTGVEPSLLLHPLDFLGGDEVPELAFFPAMRMPGEEKRRRLGNLLDQLAEFEVLSMGAHAARLDARPDLRSAAPNLAETAL